MPLLPRLEPVNEEGPPQLRIGGGEVSTEQARRTSSAGRGGALSHAQRAILRVIEENGSIRAVEAGVIIHAHRNRGCWRKKNEPSATGDRHKGGGKGCCAFASTDGSMALKRLRDRGLVEQRADRAWRKAA